MGTFDPNALRVLNDPSCPYYSLRQWSGLPNVDWCEKNECGWIQESANTFSNVAFLLVAFYLRYLTHHTPSGKKLTARSPLLGMFSPVCFVMGLLSLIYHATLSLFTQALDFVGMFGYTNFLVLFNLSRLGLISQDKFNTVYYLAMAASMLLFKLFLVFNLPVQLIILMFVIALLVTEFIIDSRTAGRRYSLHYFKLGLLLIVVAGLCSAADVKRWFCWPEHRILQGHSLWHFLAALSVWAVFKFYSEVASSTLPS